GRRTHHDHPRAAPVRVAPGAAPVRAEARAPEWVVIARRIGRAGLALGPQVDHVGLDPRIGVVVVADLLGDGAVQGSSHGQLAPASEHLGVVEAVATSDEAAIVLAGVARSWPRLAIQRARQHEEAGLLRAGFGLDDLAAPTHRGAARAALSCAGGGDAAVGSLQWLGNRRATAQQGDGGDEGEGTVKRHEVFSVGIDGVLHCGDVHLTTFTTRKSRTARRNAWTDSGVGSSWAYRRSRYCFINSTSSSRCVGKALAARLR